MSPAGAQTPDGVPLAALIRIGHEVALRARRLGALSLTAEILSVDGPVLFNAEAGQVSATGRGYDLELSAPGVGAGRAPGT